MRSAAIVLALALLGCAPNHPTFQGPLAASADSLARTAALSCHELAPNSAYLGGRIVGVCDGLAADTIIAVLLSPKDTVQVIRRWFGGGWAGPPQLGVAFSRFRSECGLLVAYSRDDLTVAVFRRDSVGQDRHLIVALMSLARDRLRTCSGVP